MIWNKILLILCLTAHLKAVTSNEYPECTLYNKDTGDREYLMAGLNIRFWFTITYLKLPLSRLVHVKKKEKDISF